jgi:hypothetical protein
MKRNNQIRGIDQARIPMIPPASSKLEDVLHMQGFLFNSDNEMER